MFYSVPWQFIVPVFLTTLEIKIMRSVYLSDPTSIPSSCIFWFNNIINLNVWGFCKIAVSTEWKSIESLERTRVPIRTRFKDFSQVSRSSSACDPSSKNWYNASIMRRKISRRSVLMLLGIFYPVWSTICCSSNWQKTPWPPTISWYFPIVFLYGTFL